MTIRVRFAPSPTGHLHIGGARTALYNYAFARAHGGVMVLRIEDTDQERSRREFETEQISDLKWLGLSYDEGPNMPADRPGKFGPYRQSERLELYQEIAQKLVDEGKAYYCFCSDEELAAMKERAEAQGRPPHYDGKWRDPAFFEEAAAKLAAGEKATIRFRAPQKSYVLKDLVRGRIVFPENMVGDFVILRSNGLPVYNFCCVVDDWKMEISHVIRGEDHLSNTVRQLMIYEALGAQLPEFAHVSLLIGKDRQKLSKRHGATSLSHYREDHFLPEAVNNYLCLLGWSHPKEKDIFDLNELIAVFDSARFSKSPAIYDPEKFSWVNAQHLQRLDLSEFQKRVEPFVAKGSLYWSMTDDWKNRSLKLLQPQTEKVDQFAEHLESELLAIDGKDHGGKAEILEWETTENVLKVWKEKIEELKAQNQEFLSDESYQSVLQYLKSEKKVKGKQLFKATRLALTGSDQGPELKDLALLRPLSLMGTVHCQKN